MVGTAPGAARLAAHVRARGHRRPPGPLPGRRPRARSRALPRALGPRRRHLRAARADGAAGTAPRAARTARAPAGRTRPPPAPRADRSRARVAGLPVGGPLRHLVGRRAGAGPAAWLAALLAPVRTRPVLVAHSAGAAPALRYAHAHPERLSGLVLVSPYFLQRRPPWPQRTGVLAGPLLRAASAARLARALLGPGATAGPALESAAAQVRRPGVARRTARRLAGAQRPAERAELRALAATCPVPVRVVAGEHDPLVGDALDVPVTIVKGAGHHPQLTHPAQVAAAANAGLSMTGRSRVTPKNVDRTERRSPGAPL
ncbi:alpha/beta hydrolase [Nonomuraea sp. B10E15]|uniref:alpha/beta fold hydrolase n=1 Tax=Nonomuraea sp. B10E15 TaxID=3153560 RepID=UPI00325DB622